MPRLTETLARRAVERTYADRQVEYAQEMQRIVEATYDYIERTGSLDPRCGTSSAHAGLSTQAFYRYFRSKDELMLVLLDDGRRRLVEYLSHRMQTGNLSRGRGPGLDRRGAGPGVQLAGPRPVPGRSWPTRTGCRSCSPTSSGRRSTCW